MGGVFLLSGNSANIIKSVFVAKGHTIKTFLEVLTRSNLFSHASSEIGERLTNPNPFTTPLEIVYGNDKLNICNISTSSFNCTAISTTLNRSLEIYSVEILFCVPNSANENVKFEPSVSLTYKMQSAELRIIPAEVTSLIKLFLANSIVQGNLPENYPVNFNNLTYDSIMLFLNAHKKIQITQELAAELTQRRKEKGYTQSQLAELSANFLNTTDTPLNSLTISRIETQKINTVEIEKLYLLERTLQLPHGYFENINNAKKAPQKPKAVAISGDKKGFTFISHSSSEQEQSKKSVQDLCLSIAYCTQCGAKILRAGDKFCSRCGSQLPIDEAGASASVHIKQENVLSRQSTQGRIQMASQGFSMPRKKAAPPSRDKGKASLRKTTYKF